MNSEQKLRDAEAKLAAANTARSDAQAQLEAALTTLKAEHSDKARKAVIAAEDAARLAVRECTWAREALEQAQREHAEAEHAARVAAFSEAERACSVEVFRTQVAPIAKRLAELVTEQAGLNSQAAELSAHFTSTRTALASGAREVGQTPPRVPAFAKVLAADVALASGKTPSEVLVLFGTEAAPGIDPMQQLTLAFQGEDPREVRNLLAQLDEAERRRTASVRKVLSEGSGLDSNASPTPLSSFRGVSEECDGYRERLGELGFEQAADQIRIDPLAIELRYADTVRAAKLIDRHLATDHARAHEERQRRDSSAHAAACDATRHELQQLGCPKLAAALPRARGASRDSIALGALAAF